MVFVGPGFGNHRNLNRVAAILGAETRRLYTELVNRVQVRKSHTCFGTGIIRGHAIDGKLRGITVLSQSLHLHASHVGLRHSQETHAWDDAYQLDRIAPVEREIANLFLLDGRLHRRPLGLHQLHAGLDSDLLLYIADGEHRLHALLLAADERHLGDLPGREAR